MPGRMAGILLLAAAVAGFAYGMHRLFSERFAEGDIYPRYSTYRGDPVGCRAVYRALERYPGLRVGRVLEASDYKALGKGSVLFVLGEPAGRRAYPWSSAGRLDTLARRGVRVVVGFAPAVPARKPIPPAGAGRGPSRAGRADVDSAGARRAPGSDSTRGTADRTGEAWGFRLGLGTDADSGAAEAKGIFGDTVPWLGALRLDSLSEDWKVLYRRDGHAVGAERRLGEGSLVLLADAFWASNEALFQAPPGRLLSLLAAEGAHLLFDERNLGVARERSLADLLVRHRLHLLLPSLLLLLLAYLWKIRGGHDDPEAAAPPDADPDPGEEDGLRKLLRRNIPLNRLLEVSYAQWAETEGRASPAVRRVEGEAGRLLEAWKAAEGRKASPESVVGDYRRLQGLINQRKSE